MAPSSFGYRIGRSIRPRQTSNFEFGLPIPVPGPGIHLFLLTAIAHSAPVALEPLTSFYRPTARLEMATGNKIQLYWDRLVKNLQH